MPVAWSARIGIPWTSAGRSRAGSSAMGSAEVISMRWVTLELDTAGSAPGADGTRPPVGWNVVSNCQTAPL